jgi:hypothetical protein
LTYYDGLFTTHCIFTHPASTPFPTASTGPCSGLNAALASRVRLPQDPPSAPRISAAVLHVYAPSSRVERWPGPPRFTLRRPVDGSRTDLMDDGLRTAVDIIDWTRHDARPSSSCLRRNISGLPSWSYREVRASPRSSGAILLPSFLEFVAHHSSYPRLLHSINPLVGERPLNCGSVPRVCRYTGIHVSVLPASKPRRSLDNIFEIDNPRPLIKNAGHPIDSLPSYCVFYSTLLFIRSPPPTHIHLFHTRDKPPSSSRRLLIDHQRLPRLLSPPSRLLIS